MAGLVGLARWRSLYDFEAPELTARARLERLQHAVVQARSFCRDEGSRDELDFALAECRALLQMESLSGEKAERERVRQRMERIRRVVTYYEGGLARLNRRFWWVGFSLGLLLMAVCLLRPPFVL